MKLVSNYLFLLAAGAALLLAGCSKKPRPDPSLTDAARMGNQQAVQQRQPIAQPPQNIGDFGNTPPVLEPKGPGSSLADGDESTLAAQTVYFDFDQSAIKASERDKLKAAKDYLDRNPAHRLVLVGRCDWRGTSEYNLALGDRRASSAKKYLQTLGVAADRLDTVSKGSLEAAKNGDDAAMAKDRRVNLVVVTGQKPLGGL